MEDLNKNLINELNNEKECRKDIIRLTKIFTIGLAVVFVALCATVYGIVHIYFYSSNNYDVSNASIPKISNDK